MKYEAIIFDCDGVLIDSEVVVNRALAEALTALGLPTTLDQAIADFTGRSTEETDRMIATRLGRPLPDAFRAMVRDAVTGNPDAITAVAGATDFMGALRPGPRAVASSSSLNWIASHLERLGLARHFDGHLYSGREHVTRTKPAPDIYLHAASAIGANPAQTLVIEDSPTGVQAAIAAGMTVVGLCAGGHCRPGLGDRLRDAGAHHVVANYSEVSALLR
ncbi:HAD family phosphatase [Sphingomonas sp. LaA6.9]|uniref:HAD family hydrolase n=1 Tax=Sphingomonas sp. LaA6.9 TaxID=2919914 RepID=UPI001F4F2926|nr:HAD family phosphatase [Sphingomonas sp. LaA6.9]MCJ8159609.1 HAD family phosphatase [Sphingomonas sp. LaA6.9]